MSPRSPSLYSWADLIIYVFQGMGPFHLSHLIGIKLFLIFPYYFDICRIYRHVTSLIPDISNLDLFFSCLVRIVSVLLIISKFYWFSILFLWLLFHWFPPWPLLFPFICFEFYSFLVSCGGSLRSSMWVFCFFLTFLELRIDIFSLCCMILHENFILYVHLVL